MEFKIIACMVVKNEADIIKYTLEQALKWADYIVVLDNNSSDETKTIILELCELESRIIFWGVYGGAFRDSLRANIFNDFNKLGNGNDWWCRLDADEVYIDNPKHFLATLPHDIDHVYSASFQYYLTNETLSEIDEAEGRFNPDNFKYYKCDWSEIRFVKTNANTFWPLHFAEPLFLKKAAKQRIRLKHFQHRSRIQMQKRFITRKPEDGKNLFSHELKHNKIWDASDLVFDNGEYIYDENTLPAINETSLIKKMLYTVFPFLLKKFSLERILLPSKEKI